MFVISGGEGSCPRSLAGKKSKHSPKKQPTTLPPGARESGAVAGNSDRLISRQYKPYRAGLARSSFFTFLLHARRDSFLGNCPDGEVHEIDISCRPPNLSMTPRPP